MECEGGGGRRGGGQGGGGEGRGREGGGVEWILSEIEKGELGEGGQESVNLCMEGVHV